VNISRREAFSFGLARKLLAHYEGTPLHLDMKAVLDKIAESLEGEVTLEPEWLSEHVDVMNFRVNALTISRTCLRILYPQLNFPLKSRGRDPESDTTRNQIPSGLSFNRSGVKTAVVRRRSIASLSWPKPKE
jgi:hypothetical protein